jgi:hypothetical protein
MMVDARSDVRDPMPASMQSQEVLMPSTPLACPQVAARSFASFRVLEIRVYAGHEDIWAGFDSRQLHRKGPQRCGPFSLRVRATSSGRFSFSVHPLRRDVAIFLAVNGGKSTWYTVVILNCACAAAGFATVWDSNKMTVVGDFAAS